MRNIDSMEGFRVVGTLINNLRYAYDTVNITESKEQLQGLIKVIVADSEENRLMLNSVKPLLWYFQIHPQLKKM